MQLSQPEYEQSQQNSARAQKHVNSQERQPSAPLLPPTGNYGEGMDQTYVQQWLVNPSHPYELPTRTQTREKNSQGQQQSVVPQTVTVSQPSDQKEHSKPKDVPIRYTQAPSHPVVSKSSGKLLSPEDALKRTLKHKKVPPLTKRNSLRSIFSDSSSNLQKIAEELDEEGTDNGANNIRDITNDSSKQKFASKV